jgi:hypothetical protein
LEDNTKIDLKEMGYSLVAKRLTASQEGLSFIGDSPEILSACNTHLEEKLPI